MGGDPEAPAALRPAVAEPGILMDVRFIEVDQQMPVVLGTRQQIPELLDEGLPPPRVGPAEQLLGLLPRQPPAMEGGADCLAAAGAAERLLHPADQTPQGPAWRRVGPGYGRRRRGVLGGADDLTEAGLDLGATGGGRRCAGKPAPRGRVSCRGAATPSRSAGVGAYAPRPAWHSSPG